VNVFYHLKMVRYLLLLCLFIVFNSCSTTQSLLKKHDYAEVINETIFRLSCDAKDKRAGQLLQKAYGEALVYYQNEIDRISTSNDQFRWTKTFDAMQTTNDLADEIRYNSAASQLICEPKIYTSEITDVRQKAVAELYNAGTDLFAQNTKAKAKEAYFYFVKAGKLDPKYKDVGLKIREAKNQAIWKVIIEPVPAHTQNNGLSFSTKTFYQTLFYKLREKFPYRGFVCFYTPEEAQRLNIENPDQNVKLEIADFEMESRITTNRHSQLLMTANSVLKINSLSENKVVYKERIPWNYTEELNYSFKAGINQEKISISPDNQVFFDHFSLSLCDQIVFRLCDFFMPYNQ